MTVSPCKGCTERHEACHDHCESYQAWKIMKYAETASLRDCLPTTRRIGEKRKAPEYNRKGVWKKT